MYPFTINGFPYGRFHAGPVKEQVYAPDWRTAERRDYTMLLADIFTNFLPPEVDGSISTVPGSFKPWITEDEDRVTMAHNLAAVVAYSRPSARTPGRKCTSGSSRNRTATSKPAGR